MNVLEVKNLVKAFAGQQVLGGVTMAVPEHSVYGFLGRNGAGKTTTMKIILGLLKADGGAVSVMGEKVCYGNTPTNRYVGYLPDVPEFYPYMNAREYMELCADISGLEKKYARNRISGILSMVELAAYKKRIGGYSRGMKQRLGIAQALLGEPSLLICDEPTSALDPAGRKEILDILKDAGRTTTVIFSTHVLADAERICDRVAILSGGKIAVEGDMERIRQEHGQGGLMLRFSGPSEAGRMSALLSDTSQSKGQAAGSMRTDGEKVYLYGKECYLCEVYRCGTVVECAVYLFYTGVHGVYMVFLGTGRCQRGDKYVPSDVLSWRSVAFRRNVSGHPFAGRGAVYRSVWEPPLRGGSRSCADYSRDVP